MESGAGSAERSIKMDERDTFFGLQRKVEDLENENRMLQARLDLMRHESERATEELRKARKDMDEVRKDYEEIRDQYTSLMDRIIKLKESLSR